jgi:hypothetical protein
MGYPIVELVLNRTGLQRTALVVLRTVQIGVSFIFLERHLIERYEIKNGIADRCLACVDGGWGWAELNFCGQLGGNQRFWCDDPITSPNRCAGILYAWPEALGGVAASVGPVLFSETSTLGASTTFTPTSGSTSTTSPTSSPTTSALTSPSSDSTLSTAIGAGVGVPLGALALGVLVYLFTVERRKRRAGDKSMTLQSCGYSEESKQGMWNHPPQEVAAEQGIGGNLIAELPERTLWVGRSHA